VQSIEAVVLLLLVFVALFAALARKLKVPYPILLVVAGLLLGFVPGMPRINLDPDIVFLVFLPPLLHAAAWSLSWREFQRNFSSIAKLAVGLVFFTILGLALTAGRLLPGFDWRSAVLLGAVVAATDAIAATSIARRLGLPQHIVEIEVWLCPVLPKDSHANKDLLALPGVAGEHVPGVCTIESYFQAAQRDLVKGGPSVGRYKRALHRKRRHFDRGRSHKGSRSSRRHREPRAKRCHRH
jgi:CPA1 family monovalent cation:H+ antiporter